MYLIKTIAFLLYLTRLFLKTGGKRNCRPPLLPGGKPTRE